MGASPLDPHVATPAEIRDRIRAERTGAPFLLYRDGDDRQVIVDLSDRDRIAIGRRDSADVPLSWDGAVSRLHAELERVGDDWLVSDDGLSRNGTFVNGERVGARRRLRDGDVIAVGGTLVAFIVPAGPTTTGPTRTARGPLVDVTLTPAQRRALVALCRPFAGSTYATPASNRQIADELVVSVDTVKGTLQDLFEAFGLQDLPQNQKRAALAVRALQLGLVSRREL
ncbi:MAG TPA: FHA domain-containing protein [Solirubrobacteraceae bacterium]|nr:FHA domain-containing protein [Solirubrobacteraceae bacterium]